MTDDQKELIRCYKRLFAGDDGKRVLADLRRLTTIDRCAVDPAGPIDPMRLVYQEAQRAMMLYILSRIDFDLERPDENQAIQEDIV